MAIPKQFREIMRRLTPLLVLVSLFLSYNLASAQEVLEIQPTMIEEKLSPGDVKDFSFRITNKSPDSKTYYLLVQDIRDVGESGQPIFAAPNEKLETGVSSWVNLSKDSVFVKAGEAAEIKFTVKVPQDAFPGGHFGAIFANLRPQRPEQSGAGIGYQVGSILNFRLAGTVSEEARIREFSVDKNIYSRPDVKFSVKMENMGNVLVRPIGLIEITNMFGKQVAKLEVNRTENAAGIYPRKDRIFSETWTSSGLGFGRYQAAVAMTYGEEGRKTVNGSLSFWVIPFNIIIPVVLGLIFLLLALVFGLRWYVRMKIASLQGGVVPAKVSKNTLSFTKLLSLTVGMLILALLLLGLLLFFA